MRSGDTTGQRATSVSPRAHVLTLYREHAADVYRYLSRLTAGSRERTEDLTQAVFERTARALAAGTVVPTPPIAWLLTVARNEFLQSVRHDEREHRRLVRVMSWPATGESADATVERRVLLRQNMADLSDEQRAALVFRYHDDLPVRDVAELLGRSVEATESLLTRARRRVRDAMQEADDGT